MKFRGNTLSDEQEHCLGEYSGLANGELLRIEAGAGASKTFTLNAIATLLSANQSGLYLAYNTEIVAEVKSVFPAYVDVCTVHGLAYRYIGRHFESRLRDTITLGMFVRTFGVKPEYGYESNQLAYYAIKTAERFCVSADVSLGLHHARGGEVSTQAADLVLFYAKRYWNAMTSATEQVPIFHDVYLKMFALALCSGRLHVDYQFALLDEGQDSVAVVRQIFHYINAAKKVVVGDRFQSIYQWRYAIDALISSQRTGVASSQPATVLATMWLNWPTLPYATIKMRIRTLWVRVIQTSFLTVMYWQSPWARSLSFVAQTAVCSKS